jgi:uncharacterized protein (DUF885 family)
MKTPSLLFLLLVVTFAVGALAQAAKPDPVEKLRHDVVFGYLALSPTTATQAGYHEHSLDEKLDDYSAAGIALQRDFYKTMLRRVATLRTTSRRMSAEDQADLRVIDDGLNAALFELDGTKTPTHNPTMYVELVGNALYLPYVFDYAPKPQRYKAIIARMKRVPKLMDAARANLTDAPEVWTATAQDENDGNIGLIDETLRKDCPAELRDEFDAAAEKTIASLKSFNEWLKTDLATRTSDWRLGKARYATKFRYVLDVKDTPEQTLAAAESEIKRIHLEMQKLAGTKPVKEYLDELAKVHAEPADFLKSAEEDLKQATAFVTEKNLVVVPDTSNLKVIETPEFMRGIYGVGGFAAAPVLQPQLQSSFWVTPLPKDEARAESKLREYNKYGMQHLVVHEAMPGHWLQFQYATAIKPESRRILRGLFSNGPYVEGWAVYTQQLLSDAGYMQPDNGFRMTYYKQMLRVLTNTVLDIRLQTMGMSDDDAIKLMTEEAFQEKEEATLKLRRAKLSSVQLCMYFVGWRGWNEVRRGEEKREGKAFNVPAFHKRALEESGVPLATLPGLLH